VTSLVHAHGEIELGRCLVMGIVNRTPDSFYDGGRVDLDASVSFGADLVDEGAHVLDVGAVRAGPGDEVSEAEELDRLIPLVEALRARVDVPLSVETGRPAVARRAIDAGAGIVNDVTGLADPGLARACADTGAALVVMHHGGQIRGRPRNPRYDDVVKDVIEKCEALALQAEADGIARERIVVDPGLDFGKNTFHSLEIVRRLDEIVDAGRPVLVAPSRKDVVGETLALPPEERLEGTLALVALAAAAGAAFVRVHDVRATVRVVTMVEAVAQRVEPRAAVRGLWE
jgi:dihydropteroate synthase